MKSGGGVLLVSALQLIVGLIILFIYEGYKGRYLSHSGESPPPEQVPNGANETIIYEGGGGLMATTPMDGIFVYSIVINVFALCGLAGMMSQNKHLVLGFFAYNAVNLVVSFSIFVDVCTTIGVRNKAAADSVPYARGSRRSCSSTSVSAAWRAFSRSRLWTRYGRRTDRGRGTR